MNKKNTLKVLPDVSSMNSFRKYATNCGKDNYGIIPITVRP